MTKKVVEEEAVIGPVEPAVDAEPTIEERVLRLEAWAREVHSTPFKHGVHVVKSKIHAFYTRPDGEIEKHHVFKIDYDAAKKREPDSWTLDEPKAGVEVLDKTRLRGWETPEKPKDEEPGEKVMGPTW